MSEHIEDKPVIVNGSALPDQVMTAIRSILSIGLGWAVGKGLVDEATGTQIVGALVVLIPFAWSLYSSTRKHSKIKAIAETAPNDVAQVR